MPTKKQIAKAVLEGKVKDEQSLAFFLLEEEIKKLKEQIANITNGVDGHTPTDAELLAIIKPLVNKIPTKAGRDGKDAKAPKIGQILALVRKELPTADEIAEKVVIPAVKVVEKNLPMAGTAIRDSLELLKGDERLRADAISGLDAMNDFIKNPASLIGKYGVGGSTARNFWQLGDTGSYSDSGGKAVYVKADGSGLEYKEAVSSDEKVKYDSGDPTAGYLGAKVVAGEGITISEGAGDDENKVKISTTWLLDPVEEHWDITEGLPPDPEVGDRYISDGTDEELGWYDGYIYEWDGEEWYETIPVEGMVVWLIWEMVWWVFMSGGWREVGWDSYVALDQTTPQTMMGLSDGFLTLVGGEITADTNTYLTAETDPLSLHLNQTTPQTVTASPIADWLTASKVVFTDANKKLTSTGIGTSSQFIKGDGSLDSSTYITSESDPLSLHLNQSSAQDVTGGKPDFQEGVQIDGFDITYPTAFTPSGCVNGKTNLYFSDGATGGIYAMRVPSGKQNGAVGFYIEANAARREDPKIVMKDMNGKYAGLGHNGNTYFFSDYDMFSVQNNGGTDTINFACKGIYSMYHGENPSIQIQGAKLINISAVTALDWNSDEKVSLGVPLVLHTSPTFSEITAHKAEGEIVYFNHHFYGYDGTNWYQLDNDGAVCPCECECECECESDCPCECECEACPCECESCPCECESCPCECECETCPCECECECECEGCPCECESCPCEYE